jgi:hypothetical protein
MYRFTTQVAVILALVLTGCASLGNGEGRILDSWKGVHIDQAILQWGIPARQAKLSDGRTVYEWYHNQQIVKPGSSTGTVDIIGSTAYINTQTTPATTYSGECIRSLVADPAGIIVEGNSRGNNCCIMAIAGYCASLLNPNAK